MRNFNYKRKVTVQKKDENGKPIPLTKKVKKSFKKLEEGKKVEVEYEEEVDEVVPGKFETEEKTVEDFFNLDYFIRSHTLENGNVIVLLDDGHEVTEKIPVLKNKNKAPHPTNITEEKQRVWVQSEILISEPEDLVRLRQALIG